MRKIILLVASMFAAGTMMAQTFVSTEPTNKHAIIEEYTGVNCSYCPDGHRIVSEITAAHPGEAFGINIHQGSYAARYTTQWGNALAGQTGLTGYPAGTVNRHVFTGNATALSRGSFAQAANIIMAQASPVNVAARANVNFATREMVIEVEMYYTGNSNTATNMLNVAVLQDNIIGPQSGASANPSQVVGSQYRHMHMLRDLVTGQWGEEITTTTAGTFVTKTYTYTVPQSISNEEMVLEDLNVIVFVAEGHQEIITGCEAAMIFQGAQPKLSDLTEFTVKNCNIEFGAKAALKNMSEDAITSAELTYTINNVSNTYTWTGNIPAGETAEIELPVIAGDFTSGTAYTLETSLTGINGAAFNGNSRTVSLKKDVYSTPLEPLTFVLATDRYASETTFKFMSADGTVILQDGPWADASSSTVTEHEYTINVPAEGCYILEVYDKYGDGINGGYGAGYFTLSNSNGRLFRNNGKFNDLARYFVSVGGVGVEDVEEAQFSIYPNPAHNVLNISSNETIRQVEVYDLSGRRIMTENGNVNMINTANLSNGVYAIRIVTENGISVQKFIKE